MIYKGKLLNRISLRKRRHFKIFPLLENSEFFPVRCKEALYQILDKDI